MYISHKLNKLMRLGKSIYQDTVNRQNKIKRKQAK